MSITRLYLVRHGETTLAAEDRFGGSIDVELSAAGQAQAEAVGRRLSGAPLVRVYTSPKKRTVATARCIAAPHGLEPVEVAALREIDHGGWEGRTREEVERDFPDEYAAWTADPFRYAPQGGEPGVEVMARASSALAMILERHVGETIAVVSHKATIRLLLCTWLGIDARGYRDRLDQSPACLNAVDFKNGEHARLLVFNDVSHYATHPLPDEPRLSPVWNGDGATAVDRSESGGARDPN
jgi:broad specificity phosphatase PhoE